MRTKLAFRKVFVAFWFVYALTLVVGGWPDNFAAFRPPDIAVRALKFIQSLGLEPGKNALFIERIPREKKYRRRCVRVTAVGANGERFAAFESQPCVDRFFSLGWRSPHIFFTKAFSKQDCLHPPFEPSKFCNDEWQNVFKLMGDYFCLDSLKRNTRAQKIVFDFEALLVGYTTGETETQTNSYEWQCHPSGEGTS